MSVDWSFSGLDRLVPTADTELQYTLLECLHDTAKFAQLFMPETFNKPFNWQRLKHFELLDDDEIPKAYICATRGFFKTTALQAYLTKCAVFRTQPFVLFVSKTLEHASAITENVKLELLTNPNITEIFGRMKPESFHDVNPAFNKFSWFLSDPKTNAPYGVFVPKGQQQQVNGLIRIISGNAYRPTLIACDDVEDREEIYSEEGRKKHARWYHGALLPCVQLERPNAKTYRWKRDESNPLWRPPWRVIHQDTMKHEASNMATIIQSDDQWRGNVFPIAEERKERKENETQWVSLMPDIWSDEDADREYQNAVKMGTVEEFATEYLCIPQIPDGSGWTKDLFKYFKDNEHDFEGPDTIKFISVDSARTSNARSARSAIIAFAAKADEHKLYVRDHMNLRMEMEELANNTISMALSLRTPCIAIEVTGGDDLLKYLFENVATERGVSDWVEFLWVETRGVPREGDFGTGRDAPKRARASHLLPYYRRGEVYHEEKLRGCKLEQQQLSYPKPAKWDSLDAASHAPKIMKDMGCYWLPQTELDPQVKRLATFKDKSRWDEVIRSGSWRAYR